MTPEERTPEGIEMPHGIKLVTFGISCILISTTFLGLVGEVAAGPRVDGEPLPDWDVGTYWVYRFDDTQLDPYVLIIVPFTDDQSPGGPYTVITEYNLTPSSFSIQKEYSVNGRVATEYKIILKVRAWENGTWETKVIDTGGSPRYIIGDTIYSGDYNRSLNTTGTQYYHVANLGFKRATSIEIDNYNFKGATAQDPDFTHSSTSQFVESTTGGSHAAFKPNWDQEPMKVGDQWKQQNSVIQSIEETWQTSGDLTGSGSSEVSLLHYYNFTWQVESQAAKTIQNTWVGSNRFPKALKLVRTGSYDWDYDDGTIQVNGTVTTGPYEKWYAREGDSFDACWNIEFNESTRILWSNCDGSTNRPPEITQPPHSPIEIYEDELWQFENGDQYSINDPDTGKAGELDFTIKAELDGHDEVLSDLSIDTGGNISFIPSQQDVVDGYKITIKATDRHAKNPKSIEVSFILNIKNSNDPPVADHDIAEEISMNEGEKKTPEWNLTKVFSDIDMSPNPLNDGQPYDPNEGLIYAHSNESPIDVICTNGNPLGPSNQCDTIAFEAKDWMFPVDISILMNLTAIDKSGEKAIEHLPITVKHVNHKPVGDVDQIIADEDAVLPTIDLERHLFDPDVGNINYPTGDYLKYEFDQPKNFNVTLSKSKVNMVSDKDWFGEETLIFKATDKSGAEARFMLTIILEPINDPPEIMDNEIDDPIVIYETKDGTQTAPLSTVDLSVKAKDVDDKNLDYHWYIEDKDTNESFVPLENTTNFMFKTQFDGHISDGKFHGGRTSKEYQVTYEVIDAAGAADRKIWNIKVLNVNRNPIIDGVEAFQLANDGTTPKINEKTPGHFNLKYKTFSRFDATNLTVDYDEGPGYGKGIENLTFIWTSDIQGPLGNGPYIDAGAGRKSSSGIMLTLGCTHTITVRVMDKQGGVDEYQFELKVYAYPTESDIICGIDPPIVIIAIILATILLYWRKRTR